MKDVLGIKRRERLWVPMCKEVFRTAGLPPELGPAIARKESAFIPETKVLYGADGRRGGAYGMFCMTLQTAKALGFEDHPDKLLDPELCGLFAAKLCQENWARFDNLDDVICAYNSGKPKRSAPVITLSDYLPKVLKYMGEYRTFKSEGAT